MAGKINTRKAGHMGYKDFMGKILSELKDFYGKDASVKIHKTYKNNDVAEYGVLIQFTNDREDGIVPLIYLEGLYGCYLEGCMDIYGCIGEIINRREEFLKQDKEVKDIPTGITEWENARYSIYPVLLKEEDNRKLLKDLVATKFLDLAVIYIIRSETADGSFTSIKVKNSLCRHYGVSREKLHMQAVSNLRKDGYKFYRFKETPGALIKDEPSTDSIEEAGCIMGGTMYIMTNKAMFYGAAGILDSQWLHEKTGGTSCYIIPSSVHELIFVPDTGNTDQEGLDLMVQEVNSTALKDCEKLSDHCYYYDAGTGETRERK